VPGRPVAPSRHGGVRRTRDVTRRLRSRATSIVLAASCALASVAGSWVAVATGAPVAYRLQPSRRVASAGEHVELRLSPPAPRGIRVKWFVGSGERGLELDQPVYRAPYLILPATPPVTVSAAFSDGRRNTLVTAVVELLPSDLEATEDCLGPGQEFSSVVGDIEPNYSEFEEPPKILERVEPQLAQGVPARGVRDTIPVRALVCRSGRVLDALVPPIYRDPSDPRPIARDERLVEAAVAAVRHFVFKPAVVAGQPIAFWVNVPIVFRPR